MMVDVRRAAHGVGAEVASASDFLDRAVTRFRPFPVALKRSHLMTSSRPTKPRKMAGIALCQAPVVPVVIAFVDRLTGAKVRRFFLPPAVRVPVVR